jgi:hypothetical protein
MLGIGINAARVPLIDVLNIGAATNTGFADSDFSQTTGLQGNGSSKYLDYFLYLRDKGKEYAEQRRRLYFLRHRKDLERIGSKGWFSWKIFWNGD